MHPFTPGIQPMNDDDLLRLAHGHHQDELDEAQASLLAAMVRSDPVRTGNALALDGQIAVVVSGKRDEALLAYLRQHWPASADQPSHRDQLMGGKRWWSTIARRGGWLVAASLLFAAIAWWGKSAVRVEPALIATLVEAPGGSASLLRDGTSTSLARAVALASGDRLTVPSNVIVNLTSPGEGSIIQLEGPADLLVASTGPGKLLSLRRGRLVADLAPQPPGHPMVVRCPFTEVTVVGTAFTILSDERGDRIAVQHGTVQVVSPGAASSTPLLLSAGEAAEAGAGRPLAAVPSNTVAPLAQGTPPAATERPVTPVAPGNTAAPVGTMGAWFDFSQVMGDDVVNRADPSRPGTLIDLGLAPGRDGPALDLRSGNNRFRFVTGTSPHMTAAMWIRRRPQTGKAHCSVLMLPAIDIYLDPDNASLREDQRDSLHMTTRTRRPIAGWSSPPHLLRENQWQHLAVSVSTAANGDITPVLYVDGVSQQLWTWGGDWEQEAPEPGIGLVGSEPGLRRSIAGLVDDLRCWPRILTSAEVAELARSR
jgi:hypothetical protein